MGASLRLPDGRILDVMFWPGQEVILPMDNDYVLGAGSPGLFNLSGSGSRNLVDPIVTAPLAQAITLSSGSVALPADEAKAHRSAGQHSVSDARQKTRQSAIRHKK